MLKISVPKTINAEPGNKGQHDPRPAPGCERYGRRPDRSEHNRDNKRPAHAGSPTKPLGRKGTNEAPDAAHGEKGPD
jgi:hypothetical protein